jgi:hypothetical protein
VLPSGPKTWVGAVKNRYRAHRPLWTAISYYTIFRFTATLDITSQIAV